MCVELRTRYVFTVVIQSINQNYNCPDRNHGNRWVAGNTASAWSSHSAFEIIQALKRSFTIMTMNSWKNPQWSRQSLLPATTSEGDNVPGPKSLPAPTHSNSSAVLISMITTSPHLFLQLYFGQWSDFTLLGTAWHGLYWLVGKLQVWPKSRGLLPKFEANTTEKTRISTMCLQQM